jgi:hypothetical protein
MQVMAKGLCVLVLAVAASACSGPLPPPTIDPAAPTPPPVACRGIAPADCASAAATVIEKRANGRAAAAVFVLGYRYCLPWLRCVAPLRPVRELPLSGLVAVRWVGEGAELYELPVATAPRPVVLLSRLVPADEFIARVRTMANVPVMRRGFAAT